jgi:hypothetical protein
LRAICRCGIYVRIRQAIKRTPRCRCPTGGIAQTARENSYLVLRYGSLGSGGVLFGNIRSWLACSKA